MRKRCPGWACSARARWVCILLAAALLWAIPALSAACTLFAACGAAVEGGGVLAVKNRDWRPEYQEMRLKPAGGEAYAYYGIYCGESPDPRKMRLRGGVNAQGLVVFTATVGVIDCDQRMAAPQVQGGVIAALLGSCANVTEALERTEVFVRPQFLLLADRQEIAVIEVGPGGKRAVHRTGNGVLGHTNHYVLSEMLAENVRPPKASTLSRQARITQLLEEKAPFTLQSFLALAEDRHAGPDNSIFRTGSTPRSTQTLAVLAVYLPPTGPFVIYTKVRRAPNTQGSEEIQILRSDRVFGK